MADGGHERGAAGGGRAHEALVAEGQEVLDGPAPAGHDDDVDARVGVELADGGGDLGDGVDALDGDLADFEGQPGPAQAGVDDDVVLRLGAAPAHEPDDARREGQGALALGGEQALGGQNAAQLLDAGQQVARAHGADVVDLELEAAAARPEGGAPVGHDPQSVGELGAHRPFDGHQVAAVDGGAQGHLGVHVPQREEGHAGAAVDLDDLRLHPHAGHLRDVPLDLRRQQGQWPRVVRGGVAGQARGLAHGGGVGALGVVAPEGRGGGRLGCHMHHCAMPPPGRRSAAVAQWGA